MYSVRWIEQKLHRSFVYWIQRMGIDCEFIEPQQILFCHDDFQVRMHWSDWKKFEEHF